MKAFNKIVIIILLITAAGMAQQKYFVYFKDKGEVTPASLQKALDDLSEESIARRNRLTGGKEVTTFEDLPVNTAYIKAVEDLGITIENKLKWFNAVTAHLTPGQLSLISKLNFVEKTEPVKRLRGKRPDFEFTSGLLKQNPSSIFDLDYGSSLGQLLLSDIPIVHSKGITGQGVRIGLLDTGFDWERHESLTNATVLAEYDFIFKDSSTLNQIGDATSQHDHGTAVFSVIGGYKPGKLIGAAFSSEYILAKTEDVRSELHIEEDNYALALEWMENLGVDIVSASLGYSTFDQGGSYSYADMNGKTTIVTKASELAFSKGVVMINSAGNEGNKTWKYITAPADGFNTIAVGSVNNQNKVSGFSSLGPTYDGRIKPEILVVGEAVYVAQASTINSYYSNGGTSFAAPIAAGVAALLLSAHPYLTNVEVRDILIKTGDTYTNPNNSRGYGLTSALKAVSFPVVRLEFDQDKIYKYFFGNIKDSVTLHYSVSGYDFTRGDIPAVNGGKYTFTIPVQAYGNNFFYYFTYRDSTDQIVREPVSASAYYRYYNGKTSVEGNGIEAGKEFELKQNYPNPFNPKNLTTTVEVRSLDISYAKVEIYNMLGEKVRTLHEGYLFPGILQFKWNGRNDHDYLLPGGMYISHMTVKGERYSKKLLLIK
ncbi:MAG: S8 family serine peptidase [Ignavibacteriaceae bacterium]